FLFHSKTGYCEQFASSMALLARLLGIPARVGMGYTAGTQRSDGSWVVSTKDAHAWPELYFSGVGWLRFEPTPAGGVGQGSATVPAYTTPQLLPGAPGTEENGSSAPVPAPAATGSAGPATGPNHRPDPLTDQNGAAGVIPTTQDDGPPIG